MFNKIEVRNQYNLNMDDFSNNFLAKKPIKILGLTDLWPAQQKWNEQFFREMYGELIVPVRKYQTSTYEKIHMKLASYLDYWTSIDNLNSVQDHLYLADWEISRQQTPLLKDFSTPIYFHSDLLNELPKELKFGRTWIFIGHPHVYTPLHQDTFSTSAWLTMMQGSKIIRLVPPQYGVSLNKNSSLFEKTTLDSLSEKNIPIFDVTIEEGDTLYIPGKWFHEVRNVNKNIMLTQNFLDKWNFLNFTVEFEEKFNQPVKKIIAEREKFIKQCLSNKDMLNKIQPYIPHGLNHPDKHLLRQK